MLKRMVTLAAMLVACNSANAVDASCGDAVACKVRDGDYRIAMPEGDVRGAYVYFHGYSGSAADQMRQKRLVDTVLAHHLAFVALDGIEGSWSIPGGPEQARDDQAYVRNVLSDIGKKHGFKPANTLVGGFSLGASMAWYAACKQGNRFAGMITFSGVFWDPLPKPTDCTAKLPPMIHIHGRADGTFPLKGRPIGDRYHQGDTFQSLAIYRKRAACEAPKPSKPLVADLECETAPGCGRGTSTLCLHRGGHMVRTGDLDAALTEIGYPR